MEFSLFESITPGIVDACQADPEQVLSLAVHSDIRENTQGSLYQVQLDGQTPER